MKEDCLNIAKLIEEELKSLSIDIEENNLSDEQFLAYLNEAEKILGEHVFKKTAPLLDFLKYIIKNFSLDILDTSYNRNFSDIKLIYQDIVSRLRKFPKNKGLIYYYIKCKIELFRNDEYFSRDLIAFFDEVITKYDFIFEMDSFDAETELFNINYTAEFWRQDEILDVFEIAVRNKPSNKLYVYRLATIYSARDEYKKIISIVNKYLELNSKLKKADRFSKEYKEYMIMHETLAIAYFATNQFDKAKEQVDFVLNNLPFTGIYSLEEYNKLSLDEELPPIEDYEAFIQSLLIRMSINKQENNVKELDADSKILNNGWIIQLKQWKEWYPLVSEFINPVG
jgi:hypothetical protein